MTVVQAKAKAQQMALHRSWTMRDNKPSKVTSEIKNSMASIGTVLPKHYGGQFDELVNELIPPYLKPIFDEDESQFTEDSKA